jgi:DNA-binding beta-propeller fold protein YncE
MSVGIRSFVASASLGAVVVATQIVAAQAPAPALLVLLRSENQVGIVDPASGKIVGRVATGLDPHGVAASDDGKTAFTANQKGNSLSVIDLVARKELRRVELGPASQPHDIVFAGGKVYFTLEGYKAIGRYDPPSNKIDWLFGTGQDSTHMMVVSPDRNRIFTANRASGTLTSINGVTAGPPSWNATLIPVAKGSEGLSISPDGKEVWAATWGDGGVSIIDVATSKITQVLNSQTKHANRVQFTPDGKHVFLLDREGGDTVVMDAATRKEIKRFKVGADAMLMSPDGAHAYLAVDSHVAGGDNYIAVVDLKTLQETSRIPTGTGADALAWAPAK